MGGVTSKPCPECNGDGIAGVVGMIAPQGVLMIPIECDFCEGAGDVLYFSKS
jgi:DnaJ-class molecular chaperone